MTAPSPAERLRRNGRLRARLPVYRRRVDRAGRRIAEHAPAGRSAVMFSGGKDSMVLLHLAAEVQPGIPAFFIDDGAQTAWTYQAVEAMRARGYALETLETARTLWEFWRIVGQWGYEGPEKWEGEWHWGQDQLRRLLIDEPAERIMARGYDVQLLGLRAAESHGRKMNARVRGAVYRKQSGQTIVAPLLDWEGDDVFAYLTEHDLPISQQYLQAGRDVPLERIRTGSVLITDADAWGAKYWLRVAQPELWQQIAREFPELRRRA